MQNDNGFSLSATDNRAPVEDGWREDRAAIVTWLRKRSDDCLANLPKVEGDEEAFARWLARVEDYSFAADQIEAGVHTPLAAAPTGSRETGA